jgi:hypothetical protein
MTTQTNPRLSLKFAFWLTVMLACDFALWQTGKIAYQVFHHESAAVTMPVGQETPTLTTPTTQEAVFLQEGSQGAMDFAQRNGRPVQAFADYVRCNAAEWFIMTAYVLQQDPGMNREYAAGQALLTIRKARQQGIPLADIVQ